MSTILEEYKKLGTASDIDSLIYPKTFVFSVTTDNYTDGYVYRYFVRKINSYEVNEVSEDNYDQISDKLYVKVVVQWALVGSEQDVYNKNGKIYQIGVVNKNKKSIGDAAKILPELKHYITNYSQFFKKTS